MPAPLTVPWVVGRQRAVARALAIHLASHTGRDWSRLTHAQRDAAVREADGVVRGWARDGVLATFLYEYREREEGGDERGD